VSLSLAAVPLAAGAGALGVLSPCVWPLVPVVMASAGIAGPSGPWLLTAGLSLSFALAGTALTLLLVATGLDPEMFRYLAAGLLIVVGAVLVSSALGARVSQALSAVSARLNLGSHHGDRWGQFGVGLLLGLVWLPCVGPTLGAAIALASMGQQLSTAFVIMLAYGLGTGAVLLGAGLASRAALQRWRPRVTRSAVFGKRLLGGVLLVLGVTVLAGFDKRLEAFAVDWLPQWAVAL
jgi:cytochrome c biogenesis protein CcdA